ncbi:hypothetical protein K458DRAFT_388091 [Lentithecium fluviatile CBS 122367]|uniref:Uncharacterized protein n=1 Tax=Lentithecium fluviatile CBS 122367 TaxID=1168545 RepID=A0A6G1J4R8_9PLEO|nr:hypothetical protein K458DRAFT_388091 [Lentithecium fluviatile CBS 122367]
MDSTNPTAMPSSPNAPIQLPHTLQTYVGMVLGDGAPQQRRIPDDIADLEPLDRTKIAIALPLSESYSTPASYMPSPAITEHAAAYLSSLSATRPSQKTVGPYIDDRVTRCAANLRACVSKVGKEDLKLWMQTRTRFDLEQGAAIVIAAFMDEGRVADAVRLVRELGTVLATSCMWMEKDVPLAVQQPVSPSPVKLGRKLQLSAAKQGLTIPLATDYKTLVPLLMRVRRCKPDNRCLHVPSWMFAEADIAPPAHFSAAFTTEHPAPHPTAPREADAITLSRRHFRTDQRIIMQLFRFSDSTKRLRKDIKVMEDTVLYGGSWMQSRVFDVDDVALLSHYFFQFQRRLQRKVVSGFSGNVFMGKGEGRRLFQNNVALKSTFETVLLDIAESNDAGVIVATGNEDTLALIDRTCLLMKSYVDIYGAGCTQNLVFEKGLSGGSGRGPVDEYNLLCDVLAELRLRGREEGVVEVPGPTKKFLAKDIMYYNNAWEEDAFAGGKKAGWEDWLVKRGLAGEDGEEGWDIVVR